MNKTASSHREFHLIDADAAPVDGQPVLVAVPDGVSQLVAAPNGKRPRCEAVSGRRATSDSSCLVEPLQRGDAPCLLVLAPDDRPVCVNGQRSARVVCLRERDQLQLPCGRTFHVAVHVRCVLGRAPDTLTNKTCVVCQQAVTARIVYLCPACGSAVHCDRDDPNDVRDCLSICSECPSCHAPLVRDGYGWYPEC